MSQRTHIDPCAPGPTPPCLNGGSLRCHSSGCLHGESPKGPSSDHWGPSEVRTDTTGFVTRQPSSVESQLSTPHFATPSSSAPGPGLSTSCNVFLATDGPPIPLPRTPHRDDADTDAAAAFTDAITRFTSGSVSPPSSSATEHEDGPADDPATPVPPPLEPGVSEAHCTPPGQVTGHGLTSPVSPTERAATECPEQAEEAVEGEGTPCEAYMSPVVDTRVLTKKVSSRGAPVINGYIMLECIGSGSFSHVHLAYHVETKRYVALKVLRRSSRHSLCGLDDNSRINEEIAILKRLRHPHIIALQEVINDPTANSIYLVLELSELGSLMQMDDSGQVIPDEEGVNCIPEEEARRIVKSLIGAVRYAHQSGVAHRDIKPQNILLTANKDVKLADFGVGLMIEEWEVDSHEAFPEQCPVVYDDDEEAEDEGRAWGRLRGSFAGLLRDPATTPNPHSPTGKRIKVRHEGTVAFLPPELLVPRSEQSMNMDLTALFLADVWSLGVTVYTMCVGRLPWMAHSHSSQLKAIMDQPCPTFPGVSRELEDFVTRCLQITPVHRTSLRDLAYHPWILGTRLSPSRSPSNVSSQTPNHSFTFEQMVANVSFDYFDPCAHSLTEPPAGLPPRHRTAPPPLNNSFFGPRIAVTAADITDAVAAACFSDREDTASPIAARPVLRGEVAQRGSAMAVLVTTSSTASPPQLPTEASTSVSPVVTLTPATTTGRTHPGHPTPPPPPLPVDRDFPVVPEQCPGVSFRTLHTATPHIRPAHPEVSSNASSISLCEAMRRCDSQYDDGAAPQRRSPCRARETHHHDHQEADPTPSMGAP